MPISARCFLFLFISQVISASPLSQDVFCNFLIFSCVILVVSMCCAEQSYCTKVLNACDIQFLYRTIILVMFANVVVCKCS